MVSRNVATLLPKCFAAVWTLFAKAVDWVVGWFAISVYLQFQLGSAFRHGDDCLPWDCIPVQVCVSLAVVDDYRHLKVEVRFQECDQFQAGLQLAGAVQAAVRYSLGCDLECFFGDSVFLGVEDLDADCLELFVDPLDDDLALVLDE
jgi:hypothetical protein